MPGYTLSLYYHSFPANPNHCFYFSARTLTILPLNGFPIYYSIQRIKPWTWILVLLHHHSQSILCPIPSNWVQVFNWFIQLCRNHFKICFLCHGHSPPSVHMIILLTYSYVCFTALSMSYLNPQRYPMRWELFLPNLIDEKKR